MSDVGEDYEKTKKAAKQDLNRKFVIIMRGTSRIKYSKNLKK